MGLFDRFKKTANQVKATAEDLAEDHGEQGKDALEEVADFVDDKTGHQHGDQIDKGVGAAKGAIDDLAANDTHK